VRRDHGAAVAAQVARRSVMPLERPGGQAQATRTLTRRFADRPGRRRWRGCIAPASRAQELLETSGLGVDRIAALVGFAAPTTFRERFRRAVGTSPGHYRRAFS